MKKHLILISDDDQISSDIMAILNKKEPDIELARSPSEELYIQKLSITSFDLIIIHHHPPHIDALRLVQATRLAYLGGEILVICSGEEVKAANKAVEEGAYAYFIITSDNYEPLLHLVKRLLKIPALCLEDKLTILNRFSSFVAHELKNSFTTINNAIYFLKKKIPEQIDSIFPKYISIIENEIVHSNKLLSRLTSITQKKSLNPIPSNINEILEKTIHELPVSQKMEIVSQFDPSIPTILVDPEEIQHAFLQILKNSIQAMANQGGKLTIKTEYVNEMIKITIIDQGSGIEEEDLSLIVEPFFTTKPRNVGLGLTFAETIIKAHNGLMLFESTINQGTKCVITLPSKIFLAPDQLTY